MAAIADKAVLITGSSRGIGRALVEEALTRGARRVYAATRERFAHADPRVTNVIMDVTDATQIERAVAAVESLDVLVNNAGIVQYDDLTDRAAIEQQLATNFYGPHAVTQALLPLLADGGGAIVNNLSLNAFAPMPLIPAYSISKAAAFSMTQSLRALLADRDVTVHAVLTGPTDTDMNRGVDIPKASPQDVAAAIFDGLERGDEEIFPEPMSRSVADSWRGSAMKALEHDLAALSRQAAA